MFHHRTITWYLELLAQVKSEILSTNVNKLSFESITIKNKPTIMIIIMISYIKCKFRTGEYTSISVS